MLPQTKQALKPPLGRHRQLQTEANRRRNKPLDAHARDVGQRRRDNNYCDPTNSVSNVSAFQGLLAMQPKAAISKRQQVTSNQVRR